VAAGGFCGPTSAGELGVRCAGSSWAEGLRGWLWTGCGAVRAGAAGGAGLSAVRRWTGGCASGLCGEARGCGGDRGWGPGWLRGPGGSGVRVAPGSGWLRGPGGSGVRVAPGPARVVCVAGPALPRALRGRWCPPPLFLLCYVLLYVWHSAAVCAACGLSLPACGCCWCVSTWRSQFPLRDGVVCVGVLTLHEPHPPWGG
jgi:hypothetical protein